MRYLSRLAAVALAALALAGCGGAHKAVIATQYADLPTDKVDMLVVTTRTKSTQTGEIYSGERAIDPSLYHLVVSIPPDSARTVGEVQWPRNGRADPARHFVTVGADPIEIGKVDGWFRSVAGKRRKLLVFVHGFNNTFDQASYRLAQIVHDSKMDAAPVLFTWPSRGKALDYVYDRESATYSRDTLELVLDAAVADPNVSDVTVMAHSMGNWVMMEALRQMAIRRGKVPDKIKNVILASPDIDIDVFRTQYLALGEKPPRMTLFSSTDDRALAVSRRIGGNVERLGSVDPEVEPYRSRLERTNIVVINLSKLKGGDRLNHGKFAESPEIVRLIGDRLVEGQEIAGSDLTLGEQIAGAGVAVGSTVGNTVGTTVGTVLAPLGQ